MAAILATEHIECIDCYYELKCVLSLHPKLRNISASERDKGSLLFEIVDVPSDLLRDVVFSAVEDCDLCHDVRAVLIDDAGVTTVFVSRYDHVIFSLASNTPTDQYRSDGGE